ncbi:MAG TPA: hypothetical protein VMB75_07290 [Rhodocyclaceae bacterium]|nr:hypothetical protein [Rhodocyclaceae bacterium]
MGVDSVPPSYSSQVVNPGRDAQGDRQPSSRRQGRPKPSKTDPADVDEPRPVVNGLGQVTGRKINVAA